MSPSDLDIRIKMRGTLESRKESHGRQGKAGSCQEGSGSGHSLLPTTLSWGLGKGELWDLGQCRLTSLLGCVFGLGWRWCSPSAECEQGRDKTWTQPAWKLLQAGTATWKSRAAKSSSMDNQSSGGAGGAGHLTCNSSHKDSSGKGIWGQLFFLTNRHYITESQGGLGWKGP